MARNSQASRGEYISHFNAVRMRVRGIGNLKLTFESMGDENGVPIRIQSLIDVPMVLSTNIEPTRLANFKEQRAALLIETTEFGEYFYLSRLIVFSKPVATGYPGDRLS